MFKRFSLVAVLAIVLALHHGGAKANAQEYLGVLSEAIKPEVAERLELTDEQREKVLGLSRSRFAAAIGLGQQLREAPLSQQKIMLDSFSADSEKMLFDLLDDKQQEELSEYRVEWLGMLALADESVAQRLNLADWQTELVGEWKDKVRSERRGREAEKIRAEAERAIRQELSDSQWAEWQLLAGQVETNALGEPTPPVREQPQETVVADAGPAPAPGDAAPAAATNAVDPAEVGIENVRLVLNFKEQPWKDVIAWLASQADMSVQSDVVPPGTFTYRDKSRTYSVTEALDIMNAALLNVGYTLFRQDRMLRTIDFEADQKVAGELLKELADSVSIDELAERGKYEPIKMLFTLDRLDPDLVKEEVEQLLSIQGTVVSLPSSGQLLVTDMAGNVRTIANYIKRAEDPKSSRGSSIQVVPLKNINAEEVLAVARPLLGLEAGSNVSDDLSISTNTFGTVIYAKGAADKLQNLRDLVAEMDTPPEESEAVINIEVPYIDRHRVVGIDMQLAYEVVSQLLAGGPADIKLAPDESAKQLVLFARADDHKMVRDTLQKLAGESSGFEVIQLKHIDAQLAIKFIKEFFEISDGADASGGKPIVNGDQIAKQVWVKGSESQIEQIRDQLAKLEENYKSNDILGDRVRLIPTTGRQAGDAIEQVQALWEQAYGKRSPIRFIAPSSSSSGGLQQRTFAPATTGRSAARAERRDAGINGNGNAASAPNQEDASGAAAGEAVSVPVPAFEPGDSTTMQRPAPGHFVVQEQISASDETAADEPASNTVTLSTGDQSAEIVIMQGPAGLIITSDDKDALAKFESLWRLVTSQSAMGTDSPTVVYLTNIPAAAAKELLETTLSGSSSSSDSGGGLLGDMAGTMFGGMGGMMGALMGGGGGDLIGSSSGMASGDYSIVADPRLNALFIKANPSDMMLIEELLKVIDQVESPYVIETRGRFASIPVISQDVTQVLNTIKSLYGDRIAGVSSGGGAGGGGNQQPNPAEIIAALRGGGRGGRGGGGGGANSALTEPKISLAADTSTNMLLVFAQPGQIEEIEDMVRMMDAAGAELEEDVIVADIGAINSEVLKTGLPRILGAKVVANSSSSTTPNSSGQTSASPSDDAAAAQRRAEFFQRMREGGAFGGRGGGTTGGFPGFGGGTSGRGGTTGGFGGGNTGRGGTGGGRGGQTGGRGGR